MPQEVFLSEVHLGSFRPDWLLANLNKKLRQRFPTATTHWIGTKIRNRRVCCGHGVSLRMISFRAKTPQAVRRRPRQCEGAPGSAKASQVVAENGDRERSIFCSAIPVSEFVWLMIQQSTALTSTNNKLAAEMANWQVARRTGKQSWCFGYTRRRDLPPERSPDKQVLCGNVTRKATIQRDRSPSPRQTNDSLSAATRQIGLLLATAWSRQHWSRQHWSRQHWSRQHWRLFKDELTKLSMVTT